MNFLVTYAFENFTPISEPQVFIFVEKVDQI